MPTASARGNITLETPVLASLVGPDDVVQHPPATTRISDGPRR
jgi:hypothetical protein